MINIIDMQTKQTIAIIGATGNIGSAISKSLSKGEYRLLLQATEEEQIQLLVDDIKANNPSVDVECMNCAVNACWEAEIIISTVPDEEETDVAERIREVANQKIVISVGSTLKQPSDSLHDSAKLSAAEEFQQLLPNSKVVKTFNIVFAPDFSTQVNDFKLEDVFIAGNDVAALQTVNELIIYAGLNPIIAGELSMSRKLENTLIPDMQYSYSWQNGWMLSKN